MVIVQRLRLEEGVNDGRMVYLYPLRRNYDPTKGSLQRAVTQRSMAERAPCKYDNCPR